MAAARESLPPGTLIGTYRLLGIHRQGRLQPHLSRPGGGLGEEVVIKEFMPKKVARRDGQAAGGPPAVAASGAGLPRAQAVLPRGQGPGLPEAPEHRAGPGLLPRQRDRYLVMPNERGRNLGAYIQERRGGLSTTFILDVFLPILDALSLLHGRSMLHLDVKPATSICATATTPAARPGGGAPLEPGPHPRRTGDHRRLLPRGAVLSRGSRRPLDRCLRGGREHPHLHGGAHAAALHRAS
jgi:hypothetical protein